MFEIYYVNGEPFEVSPDMLEQFLRDFPNATKASLTEENVESESNLKPIQQQEQAQEPVKEIDTRSWIGQAWDAGKINADLYDNSDAIFDITSTKDARELSDEELNAYIELINKSESSASEMEDLNQFTQVFQKYSNEGENFLMSSFMAVKEIGNVKGFAQAAIQSYRSMINPELIKESIPTTVAGVGAGGASGAAGGPVGIIAGGLTGGTTALVTSLNYGLETVNTFNELLKEEVEKAGEDFTPDAIRNILANDEVRSRIRKDARKRGFTIATIEGATNLIGIKGAGAVLKTGQNVTSKVGKIGVGAAATGVSTTAEVGGGFAGEYLGQTVIGREATGLDLALESFSGPVFQGGINVGVAATAKSFGTIKKAITPASYEINGTKVSKQAVQDYVNGAETAEEIGSLNVKIDNDEAFAKAINEQILDVQLETQINAKINDPADRAKMVNLEKQRVQAVADVGKKGIREVPGAKEKVEAIEAQMQEIVSKYAGVDGRTSEVKARKKKADQVEKLVAEKVFKSNLDFAKKHSSIYGLEVDDTLTKEQFKQKFGEESANSDGFIEKGKIYINVERAMETKAVNVGNHELLHGILRKSIKENPDQFKNIREQLKEQVGSQWQSVENRALATDTDGVRLYSDEYLANNPDEWITLTSDAIANGDITYSESVFQPLMDFFLPILRKAGFKKIKFDTGKDVFDFLKEYNRSIHKGALSSGIVKATEGKVDDKTKRFSKESPLEAINRLLPGNIKTQEDYYKVLNDPRIASDAGVERILDNKGNLAPVIEAYIRSRSTSSDMARENIEAVKKRLANFDPAETRADGSTVGQESFGEFIFANARFGKMVAAKKLAIEAAETKRTTRLDDPDVKDIADKDTKTTSTSSVKTKLVQTKSRKLTSLADLDVESSALIKKVTKTQLAKLIESNPKNLVQEIQNILIPDLVEITRKEMGIIGEKKGELVIPDSYKAYLADTYQKTISSMEILKIRTNYKNLFKRENMGFADYKTKKSDKPSLKKDSNYRKDIFRNVTTKAEFTKYHTEGKKNKLIANQRNLALMRAEAEVVRVADNYIIENSKNLNEVYAAELRNFIDSKTVQKQKEEDKSFDSVKYSKTLAIDSYTLRDAVLTNKNVFDNNGSLLAPYKNIAGNKKDSKAVGDFVYANMHLLTPENDFKFLRKAYETLYKSGKRGTAYETDIIQTSIAAEQVFGKKAFEVVLRKPTESDALPDIILSIHNTLMNIEAKMANAQYSSVTNSIVDGVMKVKKQYSPEFMKILEDLQKESQKGIERAKKFLKENDIEWSNIKEISTEGHNMLINNIDPKTNKSYFNGISATLPLPLKFISEIYNNKKHKVFLMQLMGRGLFSMGGDTFNLGLPALEDGGDGFITLRVGSNSKHETITAQEGVKMKVKSGMRSYSYRSIPGISNEVLNSMKSNHNIETFAGVLKLMKDDNVKLLKTKQEAKSKQQFSKSVNKSRTNNDSKGITVLDFDDTLATTKSLVKFTTPEGKTGTLNAEEYASTYEDLLDKGYVFDFSDFNKVVKGKLAPLFNKAIKLQGKFGPENMFVLTARPPQAQKAIFDFLKANGLNIPLKNITGLGNSTAEAKALWVADKVGEGFNDFYFADDALQNVQAVKNMLDQFDVKSKVQQAKVKFSKSMDNEFNDIIEDITGIESVKRFDFIKARKRGASKGKFRFFIPPSHEDFVGLLYNFMGKGRKGDAHRDFLEQALVRPLNRANKEYDTARQSIATDYKSLNKQFPDVKKQLIKKTPDGDFTYQDAVRIYIWDKHGHSIPGLSPIDQKNLVDMVKADGKLQAYADAINIISKQETYVAPTDGWNSGDIRMDLDDATGRVGRAQFFEEFNENADVIFSEQNLNKIEAGYGKGVREALEDILYRIKTGRNRPSGQNAMVNRLMNYLNGSVGSVMFFNMRSALLQQMSLVNYINFADNNVFAAAKAFANQKQYWKDWSFIFNSDMLKQRRGGIQTDVNGAELAAEMRKSKSPHRFLISKLLELGFLPTQIGDNIAIATGGATYYRNRINNYLKQGLSKKEAEAKAFTDFQDITQSTQQSARPDMVSQQQASVIGKVILNFQNVTSQFNRLGKKAFLDIKNRRITKPNSTQMQSDISNAARITYYFAVQNAIFYTLQTALFAMMFDDDEEDVNNLFLKKKERLINGSIDSVLRGTGITGAVISTLKNTAIAFARQRDVNYNPDESAVIVEAFNFSPVLGIKARKVVNAEKTLNYNKKLIKEMETFDIDNPQWSAATNYVEGFTNIPLNRLYNKTQNVRQGLNNEHAAWERTLMLLGWSQYNLGINDDKKNFKRKSTNKINFYKR